MQHVHQSQLYTVTVSLKPCKYKNSRRVNVLLQDGFVTVSMKQSVVVRLIHC